jgi:ribosomal protein S18 acetylase RimI-like enzyme
VSPGRASAPRIRGLADEDVRRVAAFINAATPDDPLDEAELRRWLENPAGDVEFALLEDGAGRLLAYVDVSLPAEAPDRAWADVRIPGDALTGETFEAAQGWAEEQARLRGRTRLRAFTEPGEGLAPLLEARGYRPIRHSFRMRIDLEAPPPQPAWPRDIEVRTLRAGEERGVHEAVEDAFADHWEFFPTPYKEWAHFMVEAEDFDPALWILAWSGDELAGVSLCRRERPGRPGVGWVRQLGVRPAWRRRGLGLALLQESFGAFWRRGTRVVGLGVDAGNPTGAVRLYERAGMRVEHRTDTYERNLG